MASKRKRTKRFFGMLSKLKPINLILTSLLIGSLGFADYVSATTKTAGPLEVSYEGDTIFAQTNLSPGAVVEKTLSVKNNGSVSHSFAIATDNVSGDLADNILLSSVIDGTTVWTKTVNELSKLPEKSLTVLDNIGSGHSAEVVLKAEFPNTSDNNYQGKDLSFDIIFGTQEAEPSTGDLSIASLGRGAVSSTLTETKGEDLKTKGTDNGQGDKSASSQGQNKWLLLIVPGVALVSLAIFANTWQRNIGLPLVAGSSAYLLSQYVHGDMSNKTFWIFLGTETVGAGLIKLLVKDHHKYHIRKLHQRYFVRKID